MTAPYRIRTAADETPPAQPGWFRRNGKYVLLGLLFVPFLAFQAMKERKEKEAAAAVSEQPADDLVPGLKSRLSKAGDTFVYQDGTELPHDGLGYAVLSWDDYQKNPDRFQKAGFVAQEADFPVVVFFNLTAFDASGDPGVVRRAKDGSVVFELKDRPRKQVARMTPLRDGTFKVFFRDGSADVVSEDAWYRTYMGVEPAPKLPPGDELDKMSPDQLAKLGLARMTKDDFQKKFGGAVPAPPEPPAGQKSGVKGVVIQVGGVPAVQPVGKVDVYALAGAVDPVASVKADPRVANKATTDASGGFVLPLPAGAYTIVVEVDGKALGNAVKQDRWPTVTVGGDWVDYEFRVPPR